MTSPSSHNLSDHDSGLIRNGFNLNQLTDFARGVLSDTNSDGILDTVASPSRTQAWDLDAMGNWQSLSTNGTGQSRTHNAQNQVTGVGSATLAFDANGSMTTDETGQQFVYDAWNRIVKVLSPSSVTKVEYAYDALSRRVEADSASMGTTHFYYSTGWQLLEERDGGTSASDVDLQYFWSIDYVDALTARLDYTSGTLTTTRYALHDAQWNVTAVGTTSSGVQSRYVYDPYGTYTQLTSSWGISGTRPPRESIHLFQGGLRDYDTGLYHFRNRDYSPTLGRWTRNDPIGFEAGDTNLYRYVGNGPVNGVDPWGLFKEPLAQGMHPRNNEKGGGGPGSPTYIDGWLPLQNKETQIIQQMNQILGTSCATISQFTPADRNRLEEMLGISVDWSAFPSVAVNELAPQTIKITYVSEGFLYVAAAADAAAAGIIIEKIIITSPSALPKLGNTDRWLMEEARRRIGAGPKSYQNAFDTLVDVCAEQGHGLYPLGDFMGKPFYGSGRSGVALVEYYGKVIVVKKVGNVIEILGRFF